MLNAEEKISILKQCKLLNIDINHCYYSPKLEAEESEEIIKQLQNLSALNPFYACRKKVI